MKKKLLLIAIFALICTMLSVMFSMTVFADDAIEIGYYDALSGSRKELAVPNEDGTYTIREKSFASGGTVTLSNGTVNKEFYGWFTEDGTFYEPGEIVTFTESTKLFQAYGVTVDNFADLRTAFSNGMYVRLAADVEGYQAISLDWKTSVIDLNGFNITVKNETSNSWGAILSAIHAGRGAFAIIGEGTFTQLERTKDKSGQFFASLSAHGYGDTANPQDFWIGKGVTIVTPYVLLNNTNTPPASGMPDVKIAGNILADRLYIAGTVNGSTFDIYKSANIVLTGEEAFKFSGAVNENVFMTINVRGGSFSMTNENAVLFSEDVATKCEIIVNGGSFDTTEANLSSILSYVPESSATVTVTVNGTSYTSVVAGGCEHNYVMVEANLENCKVCASQSFKCDKCGDAFAVEYGTLGDHNWQLVTDIPPTSTAAGLKTYICTVCGRSNEKSYTLDPNEIVINVTVNTADGEIVVNETVGNVLNLTVNENGENKEYTLVGLKDFGEYLASDIVAIEIPIGVSIVNLEENTTLRKITILDNASVTFVSFKNAKALTQISIGASTVVFKNGCSNNVIQGIYSDVPGAKVNYEEKVFEGKSSITELTFSSGSEYNFTTNCFKGVNVKELIFPDYCTVNFSGEAAFYNCAVEYLYIGLGNPTLAGKPFDYCQKMQKIVLMDVNKITGDYTFCVENGGEKPVEVYIHSETMSLTANTFYQCHGIIVYTNAPLTTGFASCSAKTYGDVEYPAYTIYYGIGHKYTEGTTDPTCTADGSVGYVTDCPCGKVDEYKEYKKFTSALTNSETYETGLIASTVIPALGHSENKELIDMLYSNYFENALGTYYCSTCEQKYNETVQDSALFFNKGYSADESDLTSISYSIVANKEAIEKYEQFADGQIRYGLVASAVSTTAPICGLNGDKINLSDKSIAVDFAGTEYLLLQMKINGLKEGQKIVACGFMMEGDRALYLGQNTTSAAYSVISHAIIIEMLPKEETPSDEENPV